MSALTKMSIRRLPALFLSFFFVLPAFARQALPGAGNDVSGDRNALAAGRNALPGAGSAAVTDTVLKDTTKYETIKDLPLKPKRSIRFTTTEGTWTSLDVSPDGKTIVFDMMGDLYTVPVSGGKATQITKGIAMDTHPRFSPDGKKILFTSDRSGSENLWWIDMEKKDTFQVTKERDQNFPSATWTPDGDYIV
jgi:dipeptidyl aminopeptidase/acylaminoacyl peptidase